ncbi:MAG: hypothetical protein J5J00_10260 [Deltaproteobacteria bacterium]|nr:hypothetical protein [Deltaproteobacteria bacterium]
MAVSSSNTAGAATVWDPKASLRALDEHDARYSRGFLRCRPEKWVPAFAAHWLPLAHSLGVEMQVIEVKPFKRAPRSVGAAFYGSLEGERVTLFCDGESSRTILASIVPGASAAAEGVVLEYLARRFFSSLRMSWSGPEASSIIYTGRAATLDVNEAGAVRLTFSLNNQSCSAWLLLGEAMTDQLDRLWRRQVQSSSRVSDEPQQIDFEIAHTMLAQSEVTNTLSPGNTISFDIGQPESAILRRAGRAWLPSRLAIVDGAFAFETLASPVLESPGGDTTARISISLGTVTIDPALMSELTQPGAILTSSISAAPEVDVCVNGKPSARGVIHLRNGQTVVLISS